MVRLSLCACRCFFFSPLPALSLRVASPTKPTSEVCYEAPRYHTVGNPRGSAVAFSSPLGAIGDEAALPDEVVGSNLSSPCRRCLVLTPLLPSYRLCSHPTPPRHTTRRTIPKTVRQKWLRRLQHSKVSFAFAGHYHRSHGGGKCFPDAAIKYKPKKSKTSASAITEAAEASAMDVSVAAAAAPDVDQGDKPETKAEAEAETKATAAADAAVAVAADAAPTAADAVAADAAPTAADAPSSDDDDDESRGSEDDEEHDWGYGDDERDEEGKVSFKNVHRDFQGPTVVVTNSVGLPLDDGLPGLRIVMVRETKITHKYYPLEAIPKEIKTEERLP